MLSHPSARLPNGQSFIEVDYTLEPDQVFKSFTRNWIEATGDLTILSAIETQDKREELSRLSWVPAWSTNSAPFPVGVGSYSPDGGHTPCTTILDDILTI
jgi:hypothetical protein